MHAKYWLNGIKFVIGCPAAPAAPPAPDYQYKFGEDF